MVIKRRDFQKAASFLHEFLLKLHEDAECAELRDTLNLALLHMQKYYRMLQNRTQEKCTQHTLQLTARGLSPMTPFVDAPDKFQWKWINLDNLRLQSAMSVTDSINLVSLPPIIQAAKDGDIDQIEELIRRDPGCVNEQDGIGRTALSYAVHFNKVEALNVLLENNGHANVTAHDGSTAMHQACHDANPVALSLMLDYGGDLTIQDVHGRAPIHWAVTTHSTSCLELLLERNADVCIRDKDGLTPSMWACRMDHIQHFELLSHATSFHVDEPDGIERDANGRTWMHWAVRRMEPLECLQTLLTAETARIKDEEGKTVLLLATEMGSLPSCKLILEIAGSQCLHDLDNQGRTALHLATIGGHGDVVNYLLEQGVDLSLPDGCNATAWDYARNRQLHYCQLIIMSHQRQRLRSNPTSPLFNGFSFATRESTMIDDFNNMGWRGRSDLTNPITPPHPPKRPRTSRVGPMGRRANSLTTPDNRVFNYNQNSNDRVVSSAGAERKKERIEVTVNTRGHMNGTENSFFMDSREGTGITGMSTDVEMIIDNDEDIDGVSVGGMDVSDIEDEDGEGAHTHRTPMQASTPGSMRGPPPPHRAQRRLQPRPPPRYHRQPHPPPSAPAHAPTPPEPHYPPPSDYEELEEPGHVPQPPPSRPPNAAGPTTPQPPSGRYPGPLGPTGPTGPQAQPRQNLAQVQRSRGVPVPSPPATTPQRPHMLRQPQPLPQTRPSPRDSAPPVPAPRGAPSPPAQNVTQEQAASPTLSSQSSDKASPAPAGRGSTPPQDSQRDKDRPGSTQNKPPGVLEGRKIPPPVMLTPLQNAPKLPAADSFDKLASKKKKKKKKEKQGDQPLDIPPPRGYAAPLHPHQPRIQSAAPPVPKYSLGMPQQHDARYGVEEMEEGTPANSLEDPPMVSGQAVQIRTGTRGSALPGQRTAHVEGERTDYNSVPDSITEEDGVGPLIPPPQAFRSGTTQGRPLSQSLPQETKTAQMVPTSAKPPLPKTRHSGSALGRKSASPARRRPPTSRSGNS